MPDADFPRLIEQTEMALQVCTAGNLRTTLLLGDLVRKADQFDRFLIATDTPTGSGIMPLGMLYTIGHLASLGRHAGRMGDRRGDRQQRPRLSARHRVSLRRGATPTWC